MGTWGASELATLQPSLANGDRIGLQPSAPLPPAGQAVQLLMTVTLPRLAKPCLS